MHALCFSDPKIYMNAYEVIIGRGEPANQEYVIKDAVEGNEVAKYKQPNTLSETEFRDFWISWEEDTIRVGSGREVSKEEKVKFVQVLFKRITAVSMDTWNNGLIYWQFLRDSGVFLVLLYKV